MIRLGVASLALLLSIEVLSMSASLAAAVEEGCDPGEKPAQAYFDETGAAVGGDGCIPGDRVPATSEFLWTYEPLCDPRALDACGPRACDEAEAPARIFAVTRITRATNESKDMGGGCYSYKDEPPKITPGDVLEKLKTRPIPKSAVAVLPPNGKTLVNFRTIVSSDSKPYELDVPIFGRNVHLWLKPVAWTWDFGDGSDPVTRMDGGRATVEGMSLSEITAENGYTFHEYTEPDRFAIGLTVTWTGDYQVEGEPGSLPIPGSVGITSPDVAVEALEARPQLVS